MLLELFLEMRMLRVGHMDQSQFPIGQSNSIILRKVTVICNEYIGKSNKIRRVIHIFLQGSGMRSTLIHGFFIFLLDKNNLE